ARVDPGGQLTRDDLIDEALFTVQDLRLFWIEHGHKSPPRRAVAQPGRNEPCHCGSGRKYKLCHGAAA
ncbi:MAG: SEC-C metal-binding domain-containing protein, partial [Aquabacterium sp.]